MGNSKWIFQLLSMEKIKLEEKRDELEDGHQKILCINKLARAESQMKNIKKEYEQRENNNIKYSGKIAIKKYRFFPFSILYNFLLLIYINSAYY